ncbi:hypothetical protein LCGC14_2019190 [marine sediment metagenome]|uniref:Uncharacterized protein n=1 Tax=marine sediment metagenome TaxID=412755 RepID=A0A0F9EY23_9ZZZZ
MKKIIIALIVLGILAFGASLSSADSTRTINHNFRAITTETAAAGPAVLSAGTIYRITGYATATNGVWAVYDSATASGIADSNCAIEGGEATSGDPFGHYDFGKEGLRFGNGIVVVAHGCTVVIEYL